MISNFFIVVIALIVVALVLLQFNGIKHRLLSFIIISFALFLIISLGYVYFNNDLDVSSFDGLLDATKIYFSWVGTIFNNLGDITVFAIKQDWTASNSTIA